MSAIGGGSFFLMRIGAPVLGLTVLTVSRLLVAALFLLLVSYWLVCCPANSLHMKLRLHTHGFVANPRDSTSYRCGLRLALGVNPSVLFHAAICGTAH